MNENSANKEHIEELLMSMKYMEVLPDPDDPGFSKVLSLLAVHINDLIQHDFNGLLSVLYRVDLSEEKVRKSLEEAALSETAGHTIAALIIDRQQQKLKFRKMYAKKN